MRFKTMPGRRRDVGVKPDEFQEGDFVWVQGQLSHPYLVYRPPGVDMVYTAFVTTDQAKADKSGSSGRYWWWNGNRDRPTLKPSIGVPAEPPYLWHGFLVDGVWKA